jgi:hypothetical protein
MKIANKNAREYVLQRKPFEGNNLYAVTRQSLSPDPENFNTVQHYVVYSYGEHYPLFIYIGGHWFENEDKYSVSTSKHRSQSHPHAVTFPLSTRWMKVLAEQGYVALAKMRVTEGVTWL